MVAVTVAVARRSLLRASSALYVSCALWTWGCAAQYHEAELAAFEPSTTGEGVEVVLAWAAPVDLDLYVTDPTLETVYFGNTPSGTGGRLESDLRCDDIDPSETVYVERVSWKTSPTGRYRVGVDYPNQCGAGREEVRARVVAVGEGKRWTRDLKVRFHAFEPAVLEFEVDGRRNP